MFVVRTGPVGAGIVGSGVGRDGCLGFFRDGLLVDELCGLRIAVMRRLGCGSRHLSTPSRLLEAPGRLATKDDA